MAEAIVSGLLKKGIVNPSQICATDVDAQRLSHFSKTFKVRVSHNNQEAAKSSDIILLAIKTSSYE